MKQRPLLFLFVATALAAPLVIRAQQPAFRSAIDVVSMNVTVTDSTNKYITDLTEKDFEIFEDGVKQELTLFNRTNLPVALSLLIDTSSSMEDRMATAQEAAIGFVRKLRPTDLGEVIGFDSRAEVLQKFTSNTPELDLARRSETAIYAIGLMEDTAGGQSKGFREATYALRQLTNDTGGRAFFPADLRTLAAVYGQIYDELSSQYTIGYTSKNSKRDGAWRRLVVRVARPNVQARTKQGYFAPVAASTVR